MLLAVLAVTWLGTTRDCHGGALRSPVQRYDVLALEVREVGHHIGPDGDLWPDYSRTFVRSVPAPPVDLDPPRGGVVGWDGMWDAGWNLQPPAVVTITLAGNRSDQPCQ